MANEDKPDFMALNRYRNVNKKEIEDAKRFVLSSTKDKSKVASWVKRYADHLTVKDGKLLLDGRQVIGNDERDDLMRELVYKKNSDIAPSRDAGYYKVKKRYANVSRRNWMDFLKKQRVIRMTDNAPPKQKHGGRKLNKKGELECDLFYIGKDDLPKSLQSGTAEQTYALNVVDRLTSYCKVYFLGGTRTAKKVRPFLVKAVAFFAKLLNVEKKDMHMYHDGGGEFSDKNMDSLGVPHTQLEVGPKVEQKNSHVQRVFHRLKNSKRISSITDGLAQAEKIVNGSYNRIMKMSAEEAVEKYNDPEETKKLILKYNDQREKADLDRRADLSIGDYVRIVVKSTKESEFYKAYRGKTYTREGYPVNPKNKHLYKGRSVTKEAYEVTESKGKNPKRYKVDGKWFTRDRLSEPLPMKKDKDGKKKLDYPDKKSEALLSKRKDRHKALPDDPVDAIDTDEDTDPDEEENKDEEKQAEVPAKKPKPKPKKKKKTSVTGTKTAPHFKDHIAATKAVDSVVNQIETGKITNKLKESVQQLIEFYSWHAKYGVKMLITDKDKETLKQLKKIRKEIA